MNKIYTRYEIDNLLREQYAIAFEAGRVAEREECAKVCDEMAEADNGYWCAMNIRAIGKSK